MKESKVLIKNGYKTPSLLLRRRNLESQFKVLNLAKTLLRQKAIYDVPAAADMNNDGRTEQVRTQGLQLR